MLDVLAPIWAVLVVLLTPSWIKFHITLWLWRYTRTIVHSISHWSYKSKPIPEKPQYTPDDVTVVIPTIHNVFEELRPSLESILATRPRQLIMITTRDKYEALQELAATLSMPDAILVLETEIANKRLQVCEALPHVKTSITIMADDDVWWPSTLLPWILAPFEDPQIGGVGTCQRVRRERGQGLNNNIWNWLGAAYIERRNFEISATHNMDGGTSCMSGRTGAYRSAILSSGDFLEGFKTERWGKYILNADDDNFVTRWLVNHQWKTWIQYEKECEIETTLEYGMKFLYQCSRWARSNWRSNWTSLVKERYVLAQQPWCTYALHMATFTSLAFIGDPLILLSLWWGTSGWDAETRRNALIAELVWIFAFTKVVKLVGLWRKHPEDIIYWPVSIVFGYFHGLIKLYALITLNMTSWGSRPDGDADDGLRMSPRPGPHEATLTPRKRPDDLDAVLAKRRLQQQGAATSEKGALALQYGDEEPVPAVPTTAADVPDSLPAQLVLGNNLPPPAPGAWLALPRRREPARHTVRGRLSRAWISHSIYLEMGLPRAPWPNTPHQPTSSCAASVQNKQRIGA